MAKPKETKALPDWVVAMPTSPPPVRAEDPHIPIIIIGGVRWAVCPWCRGKAYRVNADTQGFENARDAVSSHMDAHRPWTWR